jgi:sec-independent protein translocase protein TatB
MKMGLGMPEVILILVIALIVFGPRKLPELGRSMGQAMAQFRRASEDFKRTWEQEVELEKVAPHSSHDASSTLSSHSSTTSSPEYSADPYSYGYEPDVYGAEHHPASEQTAVTESAPPATPPQSTPSTEGETQTIAQSSEAESKNPAEERHWI